MVNISVGNIWCDEGVLKLKNTNIKDVGALMFRRAGGFLRSPFFNTLLAVIFGAVAIALLIPGSSSASTHQGDFRVSGIFFAILTMLFATISAWKFGRFTERRRARQSLFETLSESEEALF